MGYNVKKRILFTIHQFLPEHATGTEILTLNTAKELQARGYDVGVLSFVNSDNPRPYWKGGLHRSIFADIPIWKLEFSLGGVQRPLSLEYNNPTMKIFIRGFLKEYQPSIIHIMHNMRLSASVIDVYKEMNIPTIMTTTDFWIICPRFTLLDTKLKNCIGPFNSAKCRKCTPPIYQKSEAVICARERPSYLMSQMNKLDKVVVPTEFMRQMLSKYGANADLITTLPFGLKDVDSYYNDIKQYQGKLNIAYIGSIQRHKGLHVLLKAVRKIKSDNITINIYGDTSTDPIYTEEVTKISSNDLRIKFNGTFPNVQINDVMKQIDVLVVPSIWYENTPLVIYSALAGKVPVIATDLGGMSYVISHDDNGLLFPVGNSDALAKCIKRLLDDHSLLTKLSSAIKPVLSMEKMTDLIEEFYSEIS
jgi:glycosyltransferase involved in cell wall biosynthesis